MFLCYLQGEIRQTLFSFCFPSDSHFASIIWGGNSPVPGILSLRLSALGFYLTCIFLKMSIPFPWLGLSQCRRVLKECALWVISWGHWLALPGFGFILDFLPGSSSTVTAFHSSPHCSLSNPRILFTPDSLFCFSFIPVLADIPLCSTNTLSVGNLHLLSCFPFSTNLPHPPLGLPSFCTPSFLCWWLWNPQG